MFKELFIRMGTFFLLIGAGIFILFIASEYAGKTNFDYLFWAVLAATIGLILRRRRPPPPPSGRFSSLRKMRQGKDRDRDHDHEK
jgi:hypothetical protein